MDMPLEFHALNSIGLIANPNPVNLSPHRALVLLLAAGLTLNDMEDDSSPSLCRYPRDLSNAMLRMSDFDEAQIIEIFECLHEEHPDVAVPAITDLSAYRDEVRHPFYRVALSKLDESVAKMVRLLGVDPQKISVSERINLLNEIVELAPVTHMLCAMIARCDFGAARQEVIESIETMLSGIPRDNECYLMLMGILVQQKRSDT